MPRPKPFDNLSSAVYNNHLDPEQVLTPRTPRSRLEDRPDQYDDDHPDTVPLLSRDNDNDNETSPRLKGTPKPPRLRSLASFANVPLILGSLLACFLFGLIVFSYRNPGQLQEYMGAKAPAQSPATDEAVYIPPPIPPPEVPLHPSQYVAQCRQTNKGFMSHGDYWDPPHMDNMGSNYEEESVDDRYKLPEGGRTTVCSKTVTYLLDGEVGLLADLALIAQAAALARERNRTFLIDDTYWNRGKWTDHFENHLPLEPGPEPGCRAPHPKRILGIALYNDSMSNKSGPQNWSLVHAPLGNLPPFLPKVSLLIHHDRHWVITAHTAKYHFGHAFSDHYENPYAHNLNRLRPIYNFARESFVSTIRPNTDLGALIRSARHELENTISPKASPSNLTYLAVHVRRGDRKLRLISSDLPYVPISEYTAAIETTHRRLSNAVDNSVTFLASDSPAAEQEFSDAYNGQYFSLRQSQNPSLRELASTQDYDQKAFNALDERERVRLTKGMVVDFALLTGSWAWEGDPVPVAGICTISSSICKMMAVGLGWEKAFGEVDQMGYPDEKRKGWVELEEKGRVVPLWTAFELF